MIAWKQPADITNDLPPMGRIEQPGQGWRDDAARMNMAVLAGVPGWDVGNETCNPFPYPIDMDPGPVMHDQRMYYPYNANTEYAPLTPALLPQRLGLHQILRLK